MTIFKVPTNYGELGKLQRAPKFEHLDMEHVERNYHCLGLLWRCKGLRCADNPSNILCHSYGTAGICSSYLYSARGPFPASVLLPDFRTHFRFCFWLCTLVPTSLSLQALQGLHCKNCLSPGNSPPIYSQRGCPFLGLGFPVSTTLSVGQSNFR